jgi:hypothetical protein
MDKTARFRFVTSSGSTDNGYGTHSLVAILRGIAYETFTTLASSGRVAVTRMRERILTR